MNWNEDLSIETNRKMPAKLGRRSQSQNRQSSEELSSTDDILENTNDPNMMQQLPIRTKKAGGWADETLKSGKSKNASNLIEQERFREPNINVNDDIPVIPDLDEIQDDFSGNVAQAPSVPMNRTSTYKELDSDLLKQNSFNQLGDINISHLTRFMYAENDIRERDEPWTKELLFNELITEYRGGVNETH